MSSVPRLDLVQMQSAVTIFFPNLDEQAGMDSVKAALDSGITMLDTAFAYGFGRSEELIGKVLKDYDRSKWLSQPRAPKLLITIMFLSATNQPTLKRS